MSFKLSKLCMVTTLLLWDMHRFIQRCNTYFSNIITTCQQSCRGRLSNLACTYVAAMFIDNDIRKVDLLACLNRHTLSDMFIAYPQGNAMSFASKYTIHECTKRSYI